MDISKIQKRITQINEYKEEIKKSNELINSQLENDTEYQEAVRKAKEISATKKRIKENILEDPSNEKIVWNIKEAKEEIQTQEQILSSELINYYQKNNTDEILDENGEKIKFKISIKLSKLKSN